MKHNGLVVGRSPDSPELVGGSGAKKPVCRQAGNKKYTDETDVFERHQKRK